jgi:hypothetical protein
MPLGVLTLYLNSCQEVCACNQWWTVGKYNFELYFTKRFTLNHWPVLPKYLLNSLGSIQPSCSTRSALRLHKHRCLLCHHSIKALCVSLCSYYYPQPLACSFKGPTQLPGEHTAELQYKISATGCTNTDAFSASTVSRRFTLLPQAIGLFHQRMYSTPWGAYSWAAVWDRHLDDSGIKLSCW